MATLSKRAYSTGCVTQAAAARGPAPAAGHYWPIRLQDTKHRSGSVSAGSLNIVLLGLYSFLKNLFIYLFIYLAASGLSCSMWDLVPWPWIKPGPLHWKRGVLATSPPGEPQYLFLGQRKKNIDYNYLRTKGPIASLEMHLMYHNFYLLTPLAIVKDGLCPHDFPPSTPYPGELCLGQAHRPWGWSL